ncbi:MAG: inositol monophosphatase [Duncaniella sp.]|nr:inositol monophosphatase [Duncaniella sp.]
MLNQIIECARMAGEAALHYFRAPASVLHADNKFNDADIVTEADRASDAIIRDYVATHFPGHAILTEESGEREGASDWRWVVDPVDGTTNFFAGIPFWSVSIAVQYKGVTRYGVVFAPALGELFAATLGGGATLNGRPIECSRESKLSRSVVCTGFPVDKDRNPDCNADNFLAILPKVRDVRRLGSAALDCCYAGAGFLDAFWELALHEWDICAGVLIASEAGCSVTTIRPDRPFSILVAPPALNTQILALISPEPCKKFPGKI